MFLGRCQFRDGELYAPIDPAKALERALADLDSDEGCSPEPRPQGHGTWASAFRAGYRAALRAIGVVIE